MSFRYLCSLTAFSLVFSASAIAQDDSNKPKANEASANAEHKEEAPKRQKPHYAGVRRQQPRTNISDDGKKSSSKVKNKWFSSKTQPKVVKKETVQADAPAEPVEDRPYFQRVDNRPLAPIATQQTLPPSSSSSNESDRIERLEVKANDLKEDGEGLKYPRHGFQAPNGHAFITAEWLYWRARQSGMEYAFAKTVNFEFESGFRVGAGVHMPYDGWDVYVNYTRYVPDQTSHAEGSVFPLLLYSATSNVDDAHAHWEIDFQSVDLQVGRVYYIAKTLCLRPYFGIKGAWIDQEAHLRYKGGFVAAGQEYTVHYENDFKGAGPLIGVDANWQLGIGFSLFGNAAAAIVIGQFDLHNRQKQLDGFVPIDLKKDLNLATSMLQLEAGIAWDRNFCEEACHFGISAGFESQYWTNQNQIEQFTTPGQPYYTRADGNLGLYGLTLRARVDF